jgi:plasmid stabilization system protein ParE
VSLLEEHPRLGRAGRVPKTRELVIVGTPYLVIYRVADQSVEIAAVFHGAQRSPQLPEDLY